ncbi:extracellular solute-binding protein [Rhodococcus rhodochrous]|uniref:Extracellular solute-binding protein n=1 Tax=Rhodococcus rhodochrous TaxID=1829 RepID=A0AAW4XPX1_RHORH|nr:extracellular solute-binding protein [Rhodococcus rhodochrous]MCD2115093.1 extracellular solute-binding protein [Rhodococcus rhodochrous]
MIGVQKAIVRRCLGSTGKQITVAASVVAMSVLTACGSAGGEQAPAGPPTLANDAAWSEIQQKAREEGEVSLYFSLAGIDSVVEDFKAANPGINVNTTFAATGDLTSRLDQEMDANVQGADVVFHASPGWYADKFGADQLASLQISPQQQGEGWEERLAGNSFAEVFGYPYTLGYRTSQAAPQSLKQLLDDNPRARIGLVDPHASPAAANVYQVLRDTYGDEIMNQLAGADYKIEASNSTLAQSFAAGAFDYAYPSQSSTTKPLVDKGAPLAEVIPPEGIAGAYYNAAILRNSAHPNASQVFVNWLMSADGARSFVSHLAPATVPLQTEGAVPWGQVEAYDPADWTTEKWNDWIATNWSPLFH